jgi:preprotein translocase subunit SecB
MRVGNSSFVCEIVIAGVFTVLNFSSEMVKCCSR